MEAGIVPDNRPPGYVSGPVPGPIGNSRVLFHFPNAQGADWPAGYYAMPLEAMSTDPTDTPFTATYIGTAVTGLQANINRFTTITDDVWTTQHSLTLARNGIPTNTIFIWTEASEPVDWDWQPLAGSVNATGNARYRMVKEWVNMNTLPQAVTWIGVP